VTPWLVQIGLRGIGYLLPFGARALPAVREELRGWAEGQVIALDAAGVRGRLELLRTAGGVTSRFVRAPDEGHADSRAERAPRGAGPLPTPDVLIRFRDPLTARRVLWLRMGIHDASAENRLEVRGDPALALLLARALREIESHLLPAAIARQALKRPVVVAWRDKLRCQTQFVRDALTHRGK
jgi:hypothetical protein